MDEEDVYEIWVNRAVERYEKGDWEGEAGLIRMAFVDDDIC